MSSQRDQGSGSIWILSVVMVVLTATVVIGILSQALGARVRAAGAADAAALAAATHALDGQLAACLVAKELASKNDALLTRCHLEGADAQVEVMVPFAGAMRVAGAAHATARARLEATFANPVRLSGR